MQSLWLGIPLVLSRRFSASRFWQEIAESGATSFNTLGAMIPILLKQPVSPYESQHRVRRVLSSACPTNAWKPFEARFGVKLWEVYGAVDGGGFVVLNAGNAPAGSLGKPLGGTTYRIVNDDGEDAPVGEPGELIFRLTKDQGREVEYFRDARATENKLRGGWLRTGDLVSRDAQGFLYFVGRKTDSMRRRGENVSAFEVERQVEAHPDVLESAVFGVPSELGEEEIMVCIEPVAGRQIDPRALQAFLQGRLPKFAVPRYVEILAELPRTATHRVQKNVLKRRGISAATVDLHHGDRP
jgi:crotonobetaine/carnitine-CoA ligase